MTIFSKNTILFLLVSILISLVLIFTLVKYLQPEDTEAPTVSPTPQSAHINHPQNKESSQRNTEPTETEETPDRTQTPESQPPSDPTEAPQSTKSPSPSSLVPSLPLIPL